jgi:hypothetical protein
MRHFVLCVATAVGAGTATADLIMPTAQSRSVGASMSDDSGSQSEYYEATDFLPFSAGANVPGATATQASAIGSSSLDGYLFASASQSTVFDSAQATSFYRVAFLLTQDCSYTATINTDVSRWSMSSYYLKNAANQSIFEVYRNEEHSARDYFFSGVIPAGQYTFQASVDGRGVNGQEGRAQGIFAFSVVPAPGTACALGYVALCLGTRRRVGPPA